MKTTVVNVRKAQCDVYIGRPSKWGNPFHIEPGVDRAAAIAKYREYLRAKVERGELDPKQLKGKVLGCFCSPLPCHGDVLAEYADRGV